MTSFHLGDRERQELQALLSHDPLAKEYCRVQALLWLAAGEPVDRIARLLDVGRRTVYYWAERFAERRGLDLQGRLADSPRTGRPPTLSGIIDPLIAAVIDQDPRLLGYRSTGWTNALLRQYLKEVHQLTVS